MKKKTGSIIWKIITGIIYFIVIIFAVTALMSKFSIGGIKMFTVQSGSMEPTIKTGSLAVVKSQNSYNINNIITYKETEDPNKTITHRIVGKDEAGSVIRYTTEGDANGSPDSQVVLQPQVIGKAIFAIPYFGYAVGFARTWPGVIILIIIPATIIIYDEVGNIRKELHKRKKSKNTN